jgi:hypothetical protein
MDTTLFNDCLPPHPPSKGHQLIHPHLPELKLHALPQPRGIRTVSVYLPARGSHLYHTQKNHLPAKDSFVGPNPSLNQGHQLEPPLQRRSPACPTFRGQGTKQVSTEAGDILRSEMILKSSVC